MSNEKFRGTTTPTNYAHAYTTGITFNSGDFVLNNNGYFAFLLSNITEADPSYMVMTKGCRRSTQQTYLVTQSRSAGYVSGFKAGSGTNYNNFPIILTQSDNIITVKGENNSSWYFKKDATYTLYIQNLDPSL